MNHFKLQHDLFRHIWQKDYSAPVTEILENGGANVLDIGCGSGVWVTEMAKAYPISHFTGIDVVPTSSPDVMENSTFLQWNFIEPLPFESKHFDYVHCRNALEAFSTNEWIEKIIPEIVRVTKPLGFVELCEIDDHYVNEGPIMKEITNAVMSYNASRRVDGMIGEKLDEILFEAGKLHDIHHQQKYSPLGSGWGGYYGKVAIDIFANKCKSIKEKLSGAMNITFQEFDERLEKCISEAESSRTYLKSHRVYAQRQESDD